MKEHPIIRVTSVEITNFKSVGNGSFHMLSYSSDFDLLDKADLIGFYGQNGSGKTVAIEVFSLLKKLLSTSYPTNHEARKNEYIVRHGNQHAEITFHFKIINKYGNFFMSYHLKVTESEGKLQVTEEELKYRENEPYKRTKTLISHKPDAMTIRTYHLKEMKEEERIDIIVAKKMASNESTSVIFRPELKSVYDSQLNDVEAELLKNIWQDFNDNLHVIETTYYGLLIANIVMPFQIHLKNQRGAIPYEMKETPLVPLELFNVLQNVVHQINIVLKTIIPNLQIQVKERSKETLSDGLEGIRFELLSKRDEVILPLRSESEGILKIISILSTLIAVYNNPNACVVIDELDAGIFEFLLGELLEVLHENGKGQLIFTSHNLRILEVLPAKNLWFTTTNEENRYLQLTVSKSNNLRDVYLRAVQLGGEQEDVYEYMDAFDMKRAFRKAGKDRVEP